MEENLKCKHCDKIFKLVGHNKTNYERHIESCISRKRKAKEINMKPIKLYFRPSAAKENNKNDDLVDKPIPIDPPIIDIDDPVGNAIADENNNEVFPPSESGDEVNVAPNYSSVATSAPMNKCKGYIPALAGNIYKNFPFQLLGSDQLENIVFENGSFHVKSCSSDCYFLNPNESDVNMLCAKLEVHEKLKTYIDNANDMDKHLSTATNMYLTHNQMSKRVSNTQKSLNQYKLKFLASSRKLCYLNKSLALHQRFMLIIKENSIPKLHEMVKVSMNRKRGLEQTINKIVDAIDGVYNPQNSENDKDLAFMILQYGGPGLLDIVHKAINLPSTSSAYRLLKKSQEMIVSSVTSDIHW